MKWTLNEPVKSLAWAAIRSGRFPVRFPALRRLQEHAFLHSLLQRLRIDCVLDVGANKGFFAAHLRRGGFRGQIVCFEPIRADAEEISRRAAGDTLWSGQNIALGSCRGELPLNIVRSGEETVLS